jgi:redox-sensitive bicupin YhaK (pirin superfamily)
MRRFPKASGGALSALADGRSGADGTALPLYADAAVLAGVLRRGETALHRLGAGRAAYLVPASGAVTVNGTAVGTRGGAAVTAENELTIVATDDAELVLVDVLA